MVKVIFIDANKSEHQVEGRAGQSLMLVAVKHHIAGIDAECGGACACATCHVYIDDPWQSQIPQPDQLESDMLDFARDVRPQSRLACQIKLTSALDGLPVVVAKQ